MRILLSILIVLLVLSRVAEPYTKSCSWSSCEGKLRFGQSICNQYDLGVYTGKTNGKGCGWDASKVYCCKYIPEEGCKLSENCYGMAYSGSYVCNKEFGASFSTPRTTVPENCATQSIKAYECCPPPSSK